MSSPARALVVVALLLSCPLARATETVEYPGLGTVTLERPHGTPSQVVIVLSGDGGWAGLDKAVAAELNARGVPVVGWDSLRHFWDARTPDGAAHDLDRLIRYYARA